MKRRKRISGFSWSKRKTIILLIPAIFVTTWGYFYSWLQDIYGHLFPIALTALLVASIAAISNLLSLQWSRNTVRPFLFFGGGTVRVDASGDYMTIPFRIYNSGSLPATNVDVDIDFFACEEEVTEDNLGSRFSPASVLSARTMILPNSDFTNRYILDLKDSNDSELWKHIEQGQVKVRLRISYESLGRKHATIQTQQISSPAWDKGLALLPIPPQTWK